ncbi:LAGLIDADG family homing endonuclease [Anaeromicrobium sediminis]|uniref:Homing endonuclease LAGLIDADG domain-containing protein n=1 Tax=Anaeromicrobium sediminis TaxID=1478221 RepID=A0A267MQ17_9FIRM|nr:LAGLIDADG family homing endonuclease [Anaeromicrobium sediminis]PAB60995.1 hypothetical protein CCE28_00760 [Anaeromicrobium sediminis]
MKWTNEEINLLKEKYGTMKLKDLIGKFFPYRSIDSVSGKAGSLGLRNHDGKKQKLWTSQEEKILKEIYGTMKLEEMVKLYFQHRSIESLSNKARQLGLRDSNKNHQKIWTKNEEQILKRVYGKIKVEEILKRYFPDRTIHSIYYKATKLGLKGKTNYNVDYFEVIDGEEKAYWLGFIYADGWITDTSNGYELGIELNIDDYKHLLKFYKAIDMKNKIPMKRERNNPSGSKKIKMCSIKIGSKKTYDDLINKGIKKNKSKTIEFPDEKIVPQHLMKHFIRGLIDGDGNYTHWYDSDNDRYITRVKLTTGSKSFAYKFSEYINTSVFINSKIWKDRGAYNVVVGNKNEAVNFMKWIYKEQTICLDRKKVDVDKILEFYRK